MTKLRDQQITRGLTWLTNLPAPNHANGIPTKIVTGKMRVILVVHAPNSVNRSISVAMVRLTELRDATTLSDQLQN